MGWFPQSLETNWDICVDRLEAVGDLPWPLCSELEILLTQDFWGSLSKGSWNYSNPWFCMLESMVCPEAICWALIHRLRKPILPWNWSRCVIEYRQGPPFVHLARIPRRPGLMAEQAEELFKIMGYIHHHTYEGFLHSPRD